MKISHSIKSKNFQKNKGKEVSIESQKNWKDKLKTITGIWEDYENAQEDFQQIRKSFDSRVFQ